jgi:hypothetical protein
MAVSGAAPAGRAGKDGGGRAASFLQAESGLAAPEGRGQPGGTGGKMPMESNKDLR